MQDKSARNVYNTDAEAYLEDRIETEAKNIFPQNVVIETTGFCNLNCIMCSNDKLTRKKTSMRWPLYIKLIEELAIKARKETRVWLCYAGEPLIKGEDFVDRVCFAKSRGIEYLVTNSNMCLMTKEMSEEVVKAGLNNIFVGLDATTADVYSQIRRGGDYNKAVQNTIDYKEALVRYGKPDQDIIVQFIDMPQNHHQRDDFVEFWERYDIKVKVRPLITWQGSCDFDIKSNFDIKDRLACFWIMNVLPVTADGYAPWCGCDYDCKGPCGDLNKSSLEEVWKTTKKEHRLIHLAGKWEKLPEFCRNCRDWLGGYAMYM